MKKEEIYLRKLGLEALDEILVFTQQLNPSMSLEELKSKQQEMFGFGNYHCFGLVQGEKLLGLCSGWVTVRLYSGKQLELDNVIIDQRLQSQGLGEVFMRLLQDWARGENCRSLELNTYVQNVRSHKFYYNQGFIILGYHFQKLL